jgi:DNA polymerase III epsilon subunit family exonuclease
MPISLLHSLSQVPIAVIDVETTGASADLGDRIIEIGIVRYEHGLKVAEYGQLIDPRRRISGGVIALTGITPEMVAGLPTFEQQFEAMMPLLRGAIVLGHNVRFDLSFLAREFRRCGCDIDQALDRAPVLDTVRIARRRFGRGGNGLQRLCRRLGYEPSVAHRALPDAITAAYVFEKLMEPVGGWDLPLCDAMAQQGGAMGLLPASPRESLLPLELEEALEQRTPVMMEYLDAREHRTKRIVEPLHIRRRNGELVLTAHCHLRDDRRTFKLERIVQLTRLSDLPEATVTQAAAAPCPPDDTLT